jgi:cytochrome c oxidase cbb3-type subunit 3
MTEHVMRPGADPDTGHDYDGIREFDNPLPRWWLLTLFGTVVFSVGYWFYYHTSAAGPSSMAAYQAELKQADALEDAREAQAIASGQLGDEQLAVLGKDPESVGRGAQVYQQTCVACHGDKGQGLIGPNLTDGYWMHGEKPSAIYKIIAAGVPDKGMPAWKPMLGGKKVKDLLAFVLSVKGTNVPGKPPQGIGADGKPAP